VTFSTPRERLRLLPMPTATDGFAPGGNFDKEKGGRLARPTALINPD